MEKHVMYPKYISNNSEQSTIAKWSYGTHMWQYILNIDCMFKYIGNTDCDETWWMCVFCVFCFQISHFWTWAPYHYCVHSFLFNRRSIKTHYASCLFAKNMKSCTLFGTSRSACLFVIVITQHTVHISFLHFLKRYFTLDFIFLYFKLSPPYVTRLHVFLICCASKCFV